MKQECQQLHARLGRISINFASLEHEVASLITSIAFQGEWIIASAVIENNSFSKNLETLKILSRSLNQSKEGKRIKEFVAVADPLRIRRNSFIHGRWIINKSNIDKKVVAVKDLRVRYKEKGNQRSWTQGSVQVIPFADLDKIESDLESALQTAEELNDEFEDFKMYT